MGFFTALAHLVNFLLPALGVAVLSAAALKLVWRREAAALAWWVLAAWAFAAGAAVTVLGLVLLGRDGRMATYLALCAACAATLWWRVFLRRRR